MQRASGASPGSSGGSGSSSSIRDAYHQMQLPTWVNASSIERPPVLHPCARSFAESPIVAAAMSETAAATTSRCAFASRSESGRRSAENRAAAFPRDPDRRSRHGLDLEPVNPAQDRDGACRRQIVGRKPSPVGGEACADPTFPQASAGDLHGESGKARRVDERVAVRSHFDAQLERALRPLLSHDDLPSRPFPRLSTSSACRGARGPSLAARRAGTFRRQVPRGQPLTRGPR